MGHSLKMGFGLYYHMLNDAYFALAKQCGADYLIVHLVDYFYQGKKKGNKQTDNQPVGNAYWGIGGSNPFVWEKDFLIDLQKRAHAFGLTIYAIENFDPYHIHDILLGGPKREQQIETVKRIITNAAAANISCLGYNFSLTGVTSRNIGAIARGGAQSVYMDRVDQTPLYKGSVWNMIYDTELYKKQIPEERISYKELLANYTFFIEQIIKHAEENNVILAVHPDDPPVQTVKNQAKLIYNTDIYKEVLALHASPYHRAELCLGTVQEMQHADVYTFLTHLLKQQKVGYIHFRNVLGKAPHYTEAFIDDGDLDMKKVVKILKQHAFSGILIPDHTPLLSSSAPWASGMAYAMGYMQALNALL